MVQPGSKGSERFLVLLLNTAESPVTSASVHASKRSATLDGKNEFYENLAAIIGSIPSKEQILLLADFNTRVGAYHNVWPSWLGQFSTGKKNDNGERMLEMCTYHDLWITNTCFKTKRQFKVSWRQMRSEHWHQLDLILVSHDDLKNALRPCSLHNANCNIDPLLEDLQNQAQRQQNAPA